MFGELQRTGICTTGNKTYQGGVQQPNFIRPTLCTTGNTVCQNLIPVKLSVYERFWKGKVCASQVCALYVKLSRFPLFLNLFLSIPNICWFFYKDLFETSKLSHFGSLILVFLSFGRF